MRGLPASTQTSPAFPPTSFNTLDGFLRFVVAVAVAVAAGIEWLLHGVHFESEKSINFYCIRISVSHAATRRNDGDVNDDKEGNVDFGSAVRFLRTAAGTEACVWICFVLLCVRVGDWYLWRKWFIYWWLALAREEEPDDPNWAKWPTHDNLIIKQRQQAAAAAATWLKLQGEAARKKTEKEREKEIERGKQFKVCIDLHWNAFTAVCWPFFCYFAAAAAAVACDS